MTNAKLCPWTQSPLSPLPPHPQTLRLIGHWLNSVALEAPEAPVFLVGTHKDKLKKKLKTVTFQGNKYRQKKLLQAQKILADFLPGMFVAKTTQIIQNLQRPSAQEWFFAVDNKSRKWSGHCKDLTIRNLRDKLQNVMMNDPRKVKGLCTVGN